MAFALGDLALVTFPKPVKPATNRSVLGPLLTGIWRNLEFGTSGTYNGVTLSPFYDCSRTYGTGYPLVSIGPNQWFKKASSYKIRGTEAFANSGVRSDYFLPGWGKPITESYREEGQATWNYPQWADVGSPHIPSNGYVAMPINVYNRLSTELMLKVGSKKASFGEALAESKETVHLLISAGVSLYRAVRAAKRGNWRGVAKALKVSFRDVSHRKTVSAKWLEYQYGWAPLMSDIYDAHQLLQKGFREKAQIASNVRVLKDSWSVKRTNGAFYGGLEAESSAIYTAKVFYKINDSTLSKFNQIGMLNPVSVAWELVPFSFVVDWFLPVGNMLEALTAPIGVDFIDGYFGTRCEASASNCLPNNPPANQEIRSDTRRCTVKGFGYTREPMSGFPLPALYYKSPFSTKHALNALALFSQLTKR